MVTIERERLISEKQNYKASAEGARLPEEAMLLRDIFKYTKPSLDAFRYKLMRCFKAWLAARGAWQQNSAREEASFKDAGSNPADALQ